MEKISLKEILVKPLKSINYLTGQLKFYKQQSNKNLDAELAILDYHINMPFKLFKALNLQKVFNFYNLINLNILLKKNFLEKNYIKLIYKN